MKHGAGGIDLNRRGRKLQEAGENYILKTFKICTLRCTVLIARPSMMVCIHRDIPLQLGCSEVSCKRYISYWCSEMNQVEMDGEGITNRSDEKHKF